MKFNYIIIGLILMLCASVQSTYGRIIFVSDVFENESKTLTLGSNDDANSTDITFNFGGVNSESLTWDFTNSRFSFSDDLRINGNQSTIGQSYIADDHSGADSDGTLNLGMNNSNWETFSWNDTSDHFNLSDDLNITGGLTTNSTLQSNGNLSIGSGGTEISKHLSQIFTNVTSASIAAQNCATYATLTMTGATEGDTIIATPEPIPINGIEDTSLSWNAYVSASDTIEIRACNVANLTLVDTADTQTWRVDLWKH